MNEVQMVYCRSSMSFHATLDLLAIAKGYTTTMFTLYTFGGVGASFNAGINDSIDSFEHIDDTGI
jgi:hypothetical protein